jgi:hypothetical protein
LVYQANPHQQVALDFASDPWTRFMHNIHTPAPYGYLWTGVSLVPYLVSGGKFILAYFLMKTWMGLGLMLYLFAIWWLLKQSKFHDTSTRWWLLALHPLLLMETLLNGHNDVWMMAPAVLGLGFAWRYPGKLWSLILSLLALLFAWNIKLAGIVLLPIAALLWLKPWWSRLGSHLEQRLEWWEKWSMDFSAVLLIMPLFIARSQWFHPWYLIWALSLWPLVRNTWLRWFLFGLSVSSLWRYVPWLLGDLQYSPEILLQMRLISWSGGIIALLVLIGKKLYKAIPSKK